jgi:acetylornithine/succinyldiaminopimelate/putrescine aminotransferase
VEEDLPVKAAENGGYLLGKLKELQERYRIVREARGMGLMIGLDLRFDILKVILGALDRGVLVLDAGRTVVRMLPPYIIEKDQIDTAVSVLDEVLGEEEAARLRG